MSSHPLQWLFELQEPQLNRITRILAQAQHTVLMAVHPWFPEFDSALRITDRDADRVSPQHRTTGQMDICKSNGSW